MGVNTCLTVAANENPEVRNPDFLKIVKLFGKTLTVAVFLRSEYTPVPEVGTYKAVN